MEVWKVGLDKKPRTLFFSSTNPENIFEGNVQLEGVWLLLERRRFLVLSGAAKSVLLYWHAKRSLFSRKRALSLSSRDS